MSDFASRGPGHELSPTPRASSGGGYAPKQQTPDEHAHDAVASFAQQVNVIGPAVEALQQAREANDLGRWYEAKANLDRLMTSADQGLQLATMHASDAPSKAVDQFEETKRVLAKAKAVEQDLTRHPPTGYKPISREADLLAAILLRPDGAVKAGMDQKERAIRAELDQLSSVESRMLVTRLDRRVPEDKLAAAFANPANLGNDRRDRLLAFLGDARRREATRETPREAPSLVTRFQSAVAAVTATSQGSPVTTVAPASPVHAGAALYLKINAQDAWQGIAAHLMGVVWPETERLTLLSDLAFTRAIGTVLYNWILNFETDDFLAILYPEDPLSLVAALGSPEGEPFPAALGLGLGQIFHRVIAAGLRRMGPRYLEAADVGAVESDQIATTCPIDRVVARTLTQDGLVSVAASTQKAAGRKAKRKISLAWQGAHDPTQWNCARSEPADATPEEVAEHLRDKYGGGRETSFFAAGLASAAPIFVLPSAWAMQVPEAAEHMYGKPNEVPPLRDDPPEARLAKLATSRAADTIALAQSPRTKRDHGVQIDAVLFDCAVQLDDVGSGLARWGLADDVHAARLTVARKQADLAIASPDDRAAWVPVATGQRTRLARISGAVRKVLGAAASMQLTDPSARAADPLRGVLRRYAAAAASAHLANACETLITEAQSAEADLALRALSASMIDLEAARGQAYTATQGRAGIGRVTQTTDATLAEAGVLENTLVNGKQADPAAIERVQIEAGEVALRARLRGLYVQLVDLRASAQDAGAGILASIASLGSGAFRDLADLTSTIEQELSGVEITWNGTLAASPIDDPSRDLILRRSALTSAQTSFEAIGKDHKIASFLRDGTDLVQWQRFRTACVHTAVMLGVSVASAGIGGLVSEGLGSLAMSVRGVEALSALSMGARGAIRFAGLLTDVAGNTAGQMAMNGDSFGTAAIQNLIMVGGTTGLLGALGHEAALTKQIEKTFAQDTAAFASLDEKLSTGWYKAGRAVQWTAKETLAITGHTIMGAAMGYVAGRVTEAMGLEGKAGQSSAQASPSELRDLLLQGASIAVGKHVHAALGERMPSYARLAARSGARAARALLGEAQHLQARAAEVARSADALAALDVFNARRRILELELAALEEAEQLDDHASRIGRPSEGPNAAERQAMRREIGEQLANARTDAALAVRFTLLGLEELVPGAVWRGTPDQARRAAREARNTSEAVTELYDVEKARTILTIDGRTVEIAEREGPQPAASATRPPDADHELSTHVARVPGSDLRGGAAPGNAAAQATHATALVAQVRDVMGTVARDAGVVAITRIGTTDNTYRITLPNGQATLIEIVLARIEGTDVARVVPNSTRQVKIGTEIIDGEHVIQIAEGLPVEQVERALADAIARVAAVHPRAMEGLHPGGAPGDLSPDDIGRLAELRVLVRQLNAEHAPATSRELLALVEYLGMREDARLAELAPHLTADEVAVIRATVRGASDAERSAVEHDAHEDLAHEQRRSQQRGVGHETPYDLTTGRVIPRDELARMAHVAEQLRRIESARTLAHYRSEAAKHPPGAYAKVGRTQIGGGPAIAGRDPNTLLIDLRGRWAADGSINIAQTAQQLQELYRAKFGDVRQVAAPNERVPLEAIRFWTDSLAVQGPVIDGAGTYRIAEDGRLLVDIQPADGSAPITLEVTSSDPALMATGFTPEFIPGLPGGRNRLGIVDAVLTIDQALTELATKPTTDPMVRDAAQAALQRMRTIPLPRLTDTSAIAEALRGSGAETPATIALMEALRSADHAASPARPDLEDATRTLPSEPAVRTKDALGTIDVGEKWHQIVASTTTADGSSPIVLGDEANLASRVDGLLAHLATKRQPTADRPFKFMIAGAGGTAVSAAEILLDRPFTEVTLLGRDHPDGLFQNIQFRNMAIAYADEDLANMLKLPKPGEPGYVPRVPRLRVYVDGHMDVPLPKVRTGTDGSQTIEAYPARPDHPDEFVGDGYIAALGRPGTPPPNLDDLVVQTKRVGGKVHYHAHFDDDGQYTGYTVALTPKDPTKPVHRFTVTGAASRFIPYDDLKAQGDQAVIDRIERARNADAHHKSGNFAGGFVASATQGRRHGAADNHTADKGEQAP